MVLAAVKLEVLGGVGNVQLAARASRACNSVTVDVGAAKVSEEKMSETRSEDFANIVKCVRKMAVKVEL